VVGAARGYGAIKRIEEGQGMNPREEDRALGIELQAIEVANKLEWAEAQGRTDDAVELRQQLALLYGELAETTDHALEQEPPADVHADHPSAV
jgi:hypothetical protein